MSKRIKRVFQSADQVLHIWANQSQDSASCANVFFSGVKVYSYGHHYLLGQLHTVKGKPVAVINSTKYSVTTAKHQSYAKQAVSHLPCITGSDPSNMLLAITETKAKLKASLDAFFKTRSSFPSDVDYNLEQVERFNSFCDAAAKKSHKIKVSKTTIKEMQLHAKACQARKAELAAIKNDPATIAKKQAAALKRASNDLASWRAGGMLTSSVRNLNMQLLRIRGDLVETSRGATVELSQAKALLTQVLSGKAKEGDKVGNFSFTKVEGETVKIGCHTIELKEAIEVLTNGHARKFVNSEGN